MSEQTPEAKALEERLRLAIRTYDFKPQEIHILHFLVDRTYGRGVERALVPSLDYVVRITRILKGDVGAVIRRLENEYGVIVTGTAPEFVSRERQDPFWFEFITTPADWRKVGPRVDREYAAQLHRELDFIERGQQRLATPDGKELEPAKLPGLKGEIAAMSHEQALRDERALTQPRSHPSIRSGPVHGGTADDREVCGNSAHEGVRKIPMRAEIPNTSSPTCEEIPHTSERFTDAGAGTRGRHVHGHGTPPGTQGMLHGHARSVADGASIPGAGRSPEGSNSALNRMSMDELEGMLDEEARYALDVLEEIVGEGAADYRRTWLLRLCDRWKFQAMRAIGEVKRRKMGGERPRIGWGETANDIFHRVKKGFRADAKRT